MSHIMPTLERLQEIALELIKLYKNDNEKRKKFLRLYHALAVKSHQEKDIKKACQKLMGALVFELEFIKEVEYSGRSPEKNKSLIGRLTGTGSSLYTIIKELLGITPDNFLNDDQRLIYLNKFYWHVKEKYPHDHELIKNVEERLKVVKEREMDRISVLAQGIPALNILKKNLAKLFDDYDKAASFRYYRNAKRFQSLNFIDIISQTADQLYHTDAIKNDVDNLTKDYAYLLSTNARAGAVLFVLLTIDKEYKGYEYLTRERGILFEKCLKVLGLKSLKNLSADKRIELLRALSLHINILKMNRPSYDTLSQQWLKIGIDMETYLTDIEKFINEQEILKNEASWSKTIANYLVRYGLGFAAAQYAADIVLPAISTTVIGGMTGPVGMAIYLAGGTLVATQLGRLVNDEVITPGSAKLFAWTLDKVGSKITDVTADAAAVTIEMTKEGYNALRGHPALSAKDQEFNQDFIDTLLELPHSILPEEEKDQIRAVLGQEKEVEQTYRVKSLRQSS